MLVTPPDGSGGASLPTRPYLRPWYALVADGDRLLLEFAGTVVAMEGAALKRLVPALLPLLDGSRTYEQIVADLGPAAEPAIAKALALLASHGALTDGPSLAQEPHPFRRSAEALAAARRDGPSPAAVLARLRSSCVAVAGDAALAEDVARSLLAAGVGAVRSVAWDSVALDGVCDMAVAVAAAGELPALRAWSRNRIEDGVCWLALPPFDGRLAPVGPLVVPGETACFECYELRRAANSDCRDELRSVECGAVPARSAAPVDALVAATAAIVVLRRLAGLDLVTPGAFYALELSMPLSLTLHRILRVPRCPACSPTATAAAPLPWFKVVSADAA